MNFRLKAVLIESFGSQTGAAKALKLSEWRLSRIIRGWDQPHDNEIDILAKALGRKKVLRLLRRRADNQKTVAEKQKDTYA